MKSAGARIAKPKLMMGYRQWRAFALYHQKEKARLAFQRELAAKGKDSAALAMELQKVQREYTDRSKLDEVALTEGLSAQGALQDRIAQLLAEVADQKQASTMAKAKEEKAHVLLGEKNKKLEHAEMLLKEQQQQAKDHLAEQLSGLRKAMDDKLGVAQKTIQELKDQLANLLAERVKMQAQLTEAAKRPKTPVAEVTPVEKKEKKPREAGILGKVDFDEDRPLGEQLKEALSKNAARVIDLFREWDANGDGEISKKEFRQAMPLLGFELPAKAIDALFDENDPDRTGVMDFKELQKMLKPAPKAAPPAKKGMGGLKGKWAKAKEDVTMTTASPALSAVDAFKDAGGGGANSGSRPGSSSSAKRPGSGTGPGALTVPSP